MKQMKRVLFRSIPLFLIALVTLMMSVAAYEDMIERETESCWEWLSVATRTMGEKIQIRFEDNLTLLDHVADSVVLKVDLDERDQVLNYLTAVQERTIFSRIDVLLPDNMVIVQTGEMLDYTGELPFRDMVAKGKHISPRVTDRITGKQVIYCAVPVEVAGKAEAVLIGMVDCQILPSLFPSYSYDGTAKLFLIDRRDGNFLMNTWHAELGNISALRDREMNEGYQSVNFKQDLTEGKEGHLASTSIINQQASYMYYVPVQGFEWTIAMMVQENQIFESVNDLRTTLLTIGTVAGALLVFYLAWNLIISSRLIQQEERMQRVEVERMTNEAKSTFLSSVSHDIRTPLNGIVGMLDVINLRGGVPEHIQDCLDKISISTQYLTTLADDVLDLTALESGKLTLAHEAFDLRTLAKELDVLVQPKAEEAKVDCHIDLQQITHARVVGSATHLRRILMNLITNAIKYNRENGQVWISFEEKNVQDNRGQYIFTVRDNGIGMTKEFQQNMFNSFVQEHAGARTQHRGHGLGLTIVSRLVDKMGGTIQVQSEKDKGSTFTVTLSMQLDTQPAQEQPAADASEANLNGMNILLVEDNELNIEIAQILLSGAGANVQTAVNGALAVEAFAASAEDSIDVILMDLMMPELDGLEATRAIRQMQRSDARTVPIIAMTASTFAEDVQRCREAGMNEHVGKPLNMQEMVIKIARYQHR